MAEEGLIWIGKLPVSIFSSHILLIATSWAEAVMVCLNIVPKSQVIK